MSKVAHVKLAVPNHKQGNPISSQALGLLGPDTYISLFNYLYNDLGCQIFVEDSIERGIPALDESHLTPAASCQFADKVLVPQIVNNLHVH